MDKSNSRHWCFTVNGLGDNRADAQMNAVAYDIALTETPPIKFYVMQLERGAAGNYHLQGYAEFKHPVRGTALRVGGFHPHWEKRMGTQFQAIQYATKEETRVVIPGCVTHFEHGRAGPGQGSRTDLEALGARVLEVGAEQAGIENAGAYIRYNKGMHALEAMANKKDNKKPRSDIRVTVLIGPTGTGKSYRAFHNFEDDDDVWIASPPTNSNWYAYGYESEKNVIFDDYRGSWMKCSALLRLLQEWPMDVNVCGGSRAWRARRVVITSNVHPRNWYPNVDEATREALMRRIHYIHQIESKEQICDIWAPAVREAFPAPLTARSSNYQPTSLNTAWATEGNWV